MEAMALETLVASVWKLEGFLSVTRHPVRVTGGYSDIDIVGIRADGSVRMAECKARGPARCVNVEAVSHGWSCDWDDSLANVARVWNSPPPWLPLAAKTKMLEFHLVGNVWFPSKDTRDRAETRLTQALRQHVPRALRSRARARVFSSAELFTSAIRRVRTDIVDDKWGKRYGDPLLDALRELVRYAHPEPKGARGMRNAIQEGIRSDLLSALFGDVSQPERNSSKQRRSAVRETSAATA